VVGVAMELKAMNMKIILSLAVVGLLLANSVVQTGAQSTNATVAVNFSLTACVQSGDNTMKTVRIVNKDIINASGVSSNGQGILAIKFTPDSGDVFFVVRQGNTETEVSSDVLSVSTDSTRVRSETTTSSGIIHRTECRLLTFSLNSDTFSFSSLQGFANIKSDNVGLGHGQLSDLVPTSGNADVSGEGSVYGDTAVAHGTVNLSGRKLETE